MFTRLLFMIILSTVEDILQWLTGKEHTTTFIRIISALLKEIALQK